MAFKKIAKIQEIKEGKIYSFSWKHLDIAIVKTNNEYYAFEDICSHDGGSISEGVLEGDKVICPRHFAEFSMKSGEALTMPATENISVFPVRVQGEDLEVDVGD
ncbi:MAG: non-heme iron oxygenase ferredoxin subunit [Leptospira sp.]|nr:non-heme iron oxygenase ferredoxin subunit [Leptospira sp.]